MSFDPPDRRISGVTINPTTYAVRFKRFATLLANQFGLSGAGAIEFTPTHVLIHAPGGGASERTGPRFALPRTAILDASAYKRRVSFLVESDRDARPRRMVLHAASETQAEAIFAALPTRLSAQRVRATTEAEDFATRMVANTPRIWATQTMVWANLAVFAATVAAGAGLFSPDPQVLVRWGANYGPLTAAGEWWRLFTCMFLHFGVLHVGLNMWALRDGGSVAERLLGNWTLLFIYLLSGIAGSSASLAWNPNANSAGASGAVFGVYGALLAYVLNRRNGVPLTVMREIRFALVMFLGYSVIVGLTSTMIDNAAHGGGFVAGVIGALTLGRPLEARARAAVPWWRMALVSAVLTAMVITGARQAISWAHASHEAKRFELLLPNFVASVGRLNAAQQRALTTLASQRFDRDQLKEQFAEQALHWHQLESSAAKIELGEHSKHQALRARLTQLASTRARAAELLAEAIGQNDAQQARDAMELLRAARELEAQIALTIGTHP